MREKPLLLLCMSLLIVALGGLTVLAAIGKFNFVHPEGVVLDVTDDGIIKMKDEDVAQLRGTAGSVANKAERGAAELGGGEQAGGIPHAEVPAIAHDFGVMDPLSMGSHLFVIRNVGDAPLELRKGPTSCKCTLSDLKDNRLSPGDEARVELTWNTGRDPLYSHHAEIYTNDPEQPAISLSIHGRVRMRIGFDPPAAIFSGVRPDRGATFESVVYSQVWDEIEFAEGESSHSGLSWRVEPADQATQAKYHAKSVYRLTVNLEPGLPRGAFREWVRLQLRVPGEEVLESFEIPVSGEVLGRLALLGPAVDGRGVLDLGVLPYGRGTKKRMALKVRDEVRQLKMVAVHTTPEFIKARLLPYEENSAGLSYIEFEVPPDARTCTYRGAPYGNIRMEFDHPRIDELELKVKLAVLDPRL